MTCVSGLAAAGLELGAGRRCRVGRTWRGSATMQKLYFCIYPAIRPTAHRPHLPRTGQKARPKRTARVDATEMMHRHGSKSRRRCGRSGHSRTSRAEGSCIAIFFAVSKTVTGTIEDCAVFRNVASPCRAFGPTARIAGEALGPFRCPLRSARRSYATSRSHPREPCKIRFGRPPRDGCSRPCRTSATPHGGPGLRLP